MNRRTLLATTGACVGAGLTTPVMAGGAPAYAIDLIDSTLPISGGDRFDVTARITNTGDAAGTDRPIRLLVGGNFIAVDVARVSLAPGETADVALGYDTYPVQVDVTFPIRVESLADAIEGDIDVAGAERTADGEMDVTITNVDDDGVRGGESLRITAEFENTGNTRINTVAQLVSVGKGAVVNEGQVVLDPGESRELIFTYGTYPVQQDVTFDVAVCTPYGSDVVTVSVGAAGGDGGAGPFSVSVYQTNDPVAGGEFLEVVASFGNGGPEAGSFTAELVVGDEVVDTREIDMARESTVIRALGYNTYPVTNDSTFPVTVRTPDDSATAQVTVFGADHEGPVTARIDSTTAPVTGGERLDVTATLTNGGTAQADAVAELVVGGEVVDTQAVTLAAGASKPVTMGYETYPVTNDSTFEVTVRTGDDSVATPVTVYGTESDGDSDTGDGSDGDTDDGADDVQGGGSPSPAVTITRTTAPVSGGELLTVYASVTNDGDAVFDGQAELVVGGEVVRHADVSVAPGESFPVVLSYDTYPVEEDVTFPVTVRAGGATDSTQVSVTGTGGGESGGETDGAADDGGESESGSDSGGTPSLSVSIANTSAPVQAGQRLDVTATVSNSGDAAASETAALVVGGETVDTASASVPAGGSTSVSLGYTTYAVEQDVTFPVTVSVGGASASTSVSVTAE